jgi:short-subunit dehydrogenase
VENILTIIGLLYTSKKFVDITWTLLNGIRVHFLSRMCRRVDYIKQYGRWAVVTGCTDGVGKAYAKELASKGMSIVLMSRTLEKLQRTAQEISEEFGVDTHIIQADFAVGQSIYKKIREELKDFDIGILVNNVGVCYEYPMALTELPEEDIWKHINVNCGAMSVMTHIVLPNMLKKRRGAVINISSSSSINPFPLMALYAASKIYVQYVTLALQREYKDSGVTFQCIIPFYISTEMISYSPKLRSVRPLVPTAETFAKSALGTLGVAESTTGYWTHGIQYAISTSVSQWVYLRLSHFLNYMLLKDYESQQSKKN